MSIHQILAELNENNSTNHKLEVLKKYKDDKLLKRVLELTYDKVRYTYGVSLEQIEKFKPETVEIPINLEFAMASLVHELSTRERTGHAALQLAANLIGNLGEEDAGVLKKIINRDLRINVGKTQINKVFKGLITKPVYMRCDVFGKKTAKNISFPALVQLKADGTYREFSVDNGQVNARSRSGEEYEYPVIAKTLAGFPDGVYVGELTVNGIHDRAQGNGLINSDNPPHDDIILETWDYITHEEYQQAGWKDRKNPCKTRYYDRFKKLLDIVKSSDNVKIIPFEWVPSLEIALSRCSHWMDQGYEGAILKDYDGVFKDGTSKHQLKLKLEIDAEMRITGFTEGRPGTKREETFGAMTFENDEGTIKGQTSGFSDAQLEDFNSRREELIGKVITVQFNDLSKAKGHDYYALSHPRFIEIREDKDETDTLDKVFKLREMAINLK